MVPEPAGAAIRPAVDADATAIAALSSQLGYPSTRDEILARLVALRSGGRTMVLVAEVDRAVIGWIAVRDDLSLETGPFAEIAGLVVDEASRGRGIGEELVARGEAWARERGHARMRVRSNVLRERAHRFYERLGYTIAKRQAVFDKTL
jgi:GNAT superfamily N-acetyltransferase